jgi:hypothetical protein
MWRLQPGGLIVVSSVRYANARRIAGGEGSRRTAKCNLVESTDPTVDSSFARTRGQVFLVLTLLIGALVGAIVVAFILVTERFGARLYPAGGAANAIKTNENRSVRTGHGELENRRTYQKATQNQ